MVGRLKNSASRFGPHGTPHKNEPLKTGGATGASCELAGIITRAPERRTARSGNEFLTIKVAVEDDTAGRIFWAVNAFRPDVIQQLEGLAVGDFIAVRGRLRAEIWRPSNGSDARINLTCAADRVEHVSREAEAVRLKPPLSERVPF